MRRLPNFTYPEPHEVVLVQKRRPQFPRRKGPSTFDQTISVLIDGQPICLIRDSTVTVETGPDMVGHLVTIRLIATTVDVGVIPKERR